MQKVLLWKFFVVLVLCLLAMIPLAMVRGIVFERQGLRQGVIQGIENGTVGQQVIKGPVLVIPYQKIAVESRQEKRGDQVVEIREKVKSNGILHFLPEVLEISGVADVQERRRGIYKAQAYSGAWVIKGRFELPAELGVDQAGAKYTWGTPVLGFGIADPRGIAPEISLAVDGRPTAIDAGTDVPGLGRGIHSSLQSVLRNSRSPQSLEFELRMNLTGLNQVQFLPMGRTSAVSVSSAWPHPSFFGPLLAQHEIDASGFRAKWKTSFLASGVHQEFARCFEGGSCEGFNNAAFGVGMIEPANLYLQLERTVKYGILFVGLTFISFLLFDVLKQCPIHPVQYGLVGGALVIFYLLLTSLSEHIPFGYAYLLAAAGCVSLIGYYVACVLGSWRRGAMIASMIASLYGVLYAILRSEDNALLMGSVLLFALLAAVMIGTRKVDWYRLASPALLGEKAA